MKKILALLCALVMLMSEVPANTAVIPYQGETLTLNFDPSPDYTSYADGYYQVTFYAYTQAMDALYELCLEFPETVTTGTVLTQDSESDSGVMFVASTLESTHYYAGTRYMGINEPANSVYTITFELAENGEYAGTLDGTLMGIGENDFTETGDSIVIDGASFRFSLAGLNLAPEQPSQPEQPEQPDTTPEPTPAPDMPPYFDMPAIPTQKPDKDLIKC